MGRIWYCLVCGNAPNARQIWKAQYRFRTITLMARAISRALWKTLEKNLANKIREAVTPEFGG
jgi:hypothetical protein